MRSWTIVSLSLANTVLLLSACGTSHPGPSDAMDLGGSPVTDAGVEGSSAGDDAPGDVAGSRPDARSTGSDASPDAGDASAGDAGLDGGLGPAASGGDAGVTPYKGVANSACADLATLRVSWWYNWTTGPSGCSVSQFVPMIWGHTGNEQSPTGIANEVTGIASRGVVLGFNEPDNTGQSNMSVAAAIALWPSFNNPSVRIGSPATQGNSAGLTWIQNFMNQVNADAGGNLRVDFIATHWYGWNAGSCDAKAAGLEAWIKQIEAIPGNRPIWITEWGCLNKSNPDAATVQAFFSGALAVFARHPRIERYAWYPWTTNNELVASGALTSLGTAFAAAPPSR